MRPGIWKDREDLGLGLKWYLWVPSSDKQGELTMKGEENMQKHRVGSWLGINL